VTAHSASITIMLGQGSQMQGAVNAGVRQNLAMDQTHCQPSYMGFLLVCGLLLDSILDVTDEVHH
jgi:hypothetical protein